MDGSGAASQWAMLGEDAQSVRRFGLQSRIRIADRSFDGFLEQHELRPGLVLYQGCGTVRSEFHLEASDRMDPATLCLDYQLDGRTSVAAPGHRGSLGKVAGETMSFMPAERNALFRLVPQPRMQMISLSVEPALLEELIGGAGGELLPGLRAASSGRVQPFSARGRMTAAIRRVAAELAEPVYIGRMKRLYLEAKAQELLAWHLDALCGPPASRGDALSARELRLVQEARERLLADLRDPPGLADLAYAVGLDPKKLNRGFRQLFGATAFEHLRDARLEAARLLLQEPDPPPLKEIAWRVGYAHPNHFITAYRRRYGLPPGLHARRLREAD